MKRYAEKIIVPFIDAKRRDLHLEKSHPALAIYDCFRGQTTPEFLSLLKKHNIISVQVPAHCTDKLQPLDVSVNKPIKDHLKKSFQSWYSEEVHKHAAQVCSSTRGKSRRVSSCHQDQERELVHFRLGVYSSPP